MASGSVTEHKPKRLKYCHNTENDARCTACGVAYSADKVGVRHIVDVGYQHTYRGRYMYRFYENDLKNGKTREQLEELEPVSLEEENEEKQELSEEEMLRLIMGGDAQQTTSTSDSGLELDLSDLGEINTTISGEDNWAREIFEGDCTTRLWKTRVKRKNEEISFSVD